MKQFWQQLNERDQSVLLVGGIIVCLYLIYLLIYSPLNNKVEHLEKDNHYQQELLTWIKQAKKSNKPTQQLEKQIITKDNALIKISQLINSHPTTKFPYQIQQTLSGKIQLSFEQVPFKMLMNSLIQLSKRTTIRIDQFSVFKTAKSGMVKSTIILSFEK